MDSKLSHKDENKKHLFYGVTSFLWSSQLLMFLQKFRVLKAGALQWQLLVEHSFVGLMALNGKLMSEEVCLYMNKT